MLCCPAHFAILLLMLQCLHIFCFVLLQQSEPMGTFQVSLKELSGKVLRRVTDMLDL